MLKLIHCFPPSQELVVAIHGLILLYEKQFQIAALRTQETEHMASNLSTSVTPTGWIHVSIEPPEVETSFEGDDDSPSPSTSSQASINTSGSTVRATHSRSPLSNGTVDPSDLRTDPQSLTSTAHAYDGTSSYSSNVGSEGKFLESLSKKGSSSQSLVSSSSASSSPNLSTGGSKRNVYSQIWKGVVFLASDPSQDVADTAQYVVRSLYDKVQCTCTNMYILSHQLHNTPHSLPPPPSHTHNLSPSLSLSLTHTHTHTHACSLAHTQQLRQKTHAKSIGVTLVGSYSPPSCPTNDVLTAAKAATMGGTGVRSVRYVMTTAVMVQSLLSCCATW